MPGVRKNEGSRRRKCWAGCGAVWWHGGGTIRGCIITALAECTEGKRNDTVPPPLQETMLAFETFDHNIIIFGMPQHSLEWCFAFQIVCVPNCVSSMDNMDESKPKKGPRSATERNCLHQMGRNTGRNPRPCCSLARFCMAGTTPSATGDCPREGEKSTGWVAARHDPYDTS